METVAKINAKIFDITMEIRDKYPELEKYLNEMPTTIPNQANPEIDIETLSNYYESLVNIVNQYTKNHPVIKNSSKS